MLLDLDAFFASAEQIARPELKGQPVIVGGLVGDRSVVASASYEARACGVKSAMPIAQAHRLCPHGVFLRGSYSLYSELSKKVIEICKTFTPLVEQASIDEAYLDLAGTQRLYAPSVALGSPGATLKRSLLGDASLDLGATGSLPTSVSSGVAPGSFAGVPMSTGPASLGVPPSGGPFSSSFLNPEPRTRNPAVAVSPCHPFTLSPCQSFAVTIAERLLLEIRRQTGLSASIGIGSNKLIARIAMESAKPGGICHVWPGYEGVFLADKPLKAIPGIGPQTAAMLADYNLHTAGDVQKASKDLLIATFGDRLGQMLHDCAWGRGPTHLEQERDQKSISRDTSFEHDTTDMAFIKSMLYYLTERACRTLRQLGQAARTVSVKLRYSDFATVAKSRTLEEPCNHDHTIYKLAEELLAKLYTRQISIRLVGVQLSGLVSAGQIQMNLWDPDYIRLGRLYEASDLIRDRYGFCALMKGLSINLMGKLEQDRAGLRLRTSCLTK
jgi:nucleotidyltransferase/DNA polymerase involved in DNA repair